MRTLALALLLISGTAYADEVITGFEPKDIPVINEELRKLDADNQQVADSVTALTARVVTLENETSAFSASYTSTAQTITAAGSLSLTHSLGSTPVLVQMRLKCTSAEGGYSVNDEVIVNPGINWYGNGSSANVGGTSLVVNSTTIDIRFGATSGSYFIVNKSDGANFQIDNTKWQLIVRAWA